MSLYSSHASTPHGVAAVVNLNSLPGTLCTNTLHQVIVLSHSKIALFYPVVVTQGFKSSAPICCRLQLVFLLVYYFQFLFCSGLQDYVIFSCILFVILFV